MKTTNIQELIENSYNKYKSKNAISIDKEYEKNINYFNFKFDIYSMARAIKGKLTNIRDNKVVIISENRYELIVTYMANQILKNTVIIIDNTLPKQMIAKVIKKYNVNTVFFSNQNKEQIKEIFKSRINNIKNYNINLINFDSKNKFPIIEYEKLINIGRYIEYNSISEELVKQNREGKDTIIINKTKEEVYTQKELITMTEEIFKDIRYKKKKEVCTNYQINSLYTLIIEILLPIKYGCNIKYIANNDNNNPNSNNLNNKQNNNNKNNNSIKIIEEKSKAIIIKYQNREYSLIYFEKKLSITRLDRKNILKNKQKNNTNFVLIKSNKTEKLKQNKDIITVQN